MENIEIEELNKDDKKLNQDLIILIKQVGQKPKFMKIKNDINEIEKIVGGHIDTYSIDDVLIVFNENHEKLNFKPNIAVDMKVIFGDCFIVGDDYINGNFKSLTKEQILKYAKFLSVKSFSYDNESKIIEERNKYLEKKGLINNLESGIDKNVDMNASGNIVKSISKEDKIEPNKMIDLSNIDLFMTDKVIDKNLHKKRGRKPKKEKIEIQKQEKEKLDKLNNSLDLKNTKVSNDEVIKEVSDIVNNQDLIKNEELNNISKENYKKSLEDSSKGLIDTNEENQIITEIRLELYKILVNQNIIFKRLKKFENNKNN